MRCPVCKADNNATPQCRRCKADLTQLVVLEQHRARALGEAVALLVSGNGKEALAAARRVDWLRRDEESQRLLAMARLLSGDYAEAWALHQEVPPRAGAAATGVAEPFSAGPR